MQILIFGIGVVLAGLVFAVAWNAICYTNSKRRIIGGIILMLADGVAFYFWLDWFLRSSTKS
jgi:hypothetical protein